MKILVTFALITMSLTASAQESCDELKSSIETELSGESYTVLDSEFLTSVTGYYHSDSDTYFVVTQIDYVDTYIYCGIPSYNWDQFKLEVYGDQVGETWHRVIKPYKCNCY